MQTFRVEITEILQKQVIIEANNKDEAIHKAQDEYHLAIDPEYILGAENHVDTEFQIVTE